MTVNITLPTSWQELSQEQLLYIFKLLSIELTAFEIQTHCLMRFGNIKLLRREGRMFLLRHEGKDFECGKYDIAALAETLSWINDIPSFPVQLECWGKHQAVDAAFMEVEFEKYIACDNLFQGFIQTHDEELLNEMATEMYCLSADHKPLPSYFLINVFYWFAALKQFFAARFSHFYKPVGSAQEQNLLGLQTESLVTEAMNAQIRALTKGDVTKEKQVLALDTWRALTELDAIAKDTEEIKKSYT